MKKNRGLLAFKVFSVLAFVIAIFFSGFLFLDKFIIPKYFGDYDIKGIGDLVGVMSSLYSSPNENSLVKNGYTDADFERGIDKLQSAGYKIEDNGTILQENVSVFKGNGTVELTDSEFASVCNKLLKSGILEDALPDLSYINTMNITIVDLIVMPDSESLNEETGTYSKANIKFIIKIDTDDLRSQIAVQMQTPEALLKIIIPSNLYFMVEYDIDLRKQDETRTIGTIGINGKNAKQSKILINLLIEFIFPKEDEMNLDKFTNDIGNVALRGIDTLGEFSFAKNIGESNKNGILVI